MLEPLYALGNDIRNARSEAELDETERPIDDILKAELSRNASGEGGGDSNEMAALGLAAQRVHYLLQQRRTVLRGSPQTAVSS
ncbi:hypothetical protein [Bradyrhizobium sp. 195]|uniref:hypothetical protein n=1 Tax=Bradyrhizobium sp. 195 TaxID=2782662 RepID=UPI002001320F|nr:hypothetical protein [Bradyrhizobium sp. 195]UPK29084.1 hypothetical protein IVB26_11970 [Bradyrhizobium sp. 195]